MHSQGEESRRRVPSHRLTADATHRLQSRRLHWLLTPGAAMVGHFKVEHALEIGLAYGSAASNDPPCKHHTIDLPPR